MSKGWMPGGVKKEIRPGPNDPQIIPTGVIYHVAVSEGRSLYNVFLNRGGIEAHFYVRRDGSFEQYRSIFYEADAQSGGNSFTKGGKRYGNVSIETQGMGSGKWTNAQLNTLKRITLWVDDQSSIAHDRMEYWNSSGIGFHAMFKQWNPHGKTCPGVDRQKQFHTDLLPWWRNKGKPKMNPTRRYRETVIELSHKALRDIQPNRRVVRSCIRAILAILNRMPKS